MKYTLCAHSIYEFLPEHPLDDFSTKDFNKLKNFFDISFDDGYRTLFTIGKEYFKNINNNVYIFINTEFIERDITIWWFELYDFIKNKSAISFTFKSIEYFYLTNTKENKAIAYKTLSNILKTQEKSHQEELLTDLKGTNIRNNYQDLFLTWEMIKELSLMKNVIIGSHTKSHANLKTLNDKQVKNELKISKENLESNLNISIKNFAIPYGDKKSFSKRELNIANDIGYTKIYTTIPNFFIINKKYKDLIVMDRLCTRVGYNNIYLIIIRLFIKSTINVFSRFNNYYL